MCMSTRREMVREMVPSESLKSNTEREDRKPRLLETNFSNRKSAGKSNKIHLSYTWHLLGLSYLQRNYSLTLRSPGINLPSLPLAFKLCFLLSCLASMGIRFSLQEFKCHELEKNHINYCHWKCQCFILFFPSASAILWPFLCGKFMMCTKLSQST